MPLSITVLGCDGTYPAPGGACSGYLVTSGGATVWLDCGPGTFANLQRHVALADVDAIVCTHEHPDHWSDLPVVRNAARYGLGIEGIRLHTTAGTLDLLRSVVPELEPTFVVEAIGESSVLKIGDQRWEFARTVHPVETLACRVEADGRSLMFSADTGDAWDARSLRPAELGLFEASLDGSEAGTVDHLTALEAGTKAREAGVGRLVITHLLPGCDRPARRAAAEAGFAAAVEVASVDDRFEV